MIIQMHQTVTNHDAIGNDIELIYNILNNKQECYVYANAQFNKNVKYISRDLLLKEIEKDDNIIIYHHSVFWEEGEKILLNAKCKILFRYHNITPESFFETYNEFHYSQCKLGREQTQRFIYEFQNACWFVDSQFNATDIEQVDTDRIFLSPPFHKIETWSDVSLDNSIMNSLIEDRNINLLFVGRVAPNKGHLFLLEVLRVFIYNYNTNIRLRIIGKFDESIAGYNQQIMALIKKYQLDEFVEFVGEINDSVLASYYLASDFFVCASEHEGFCVPILEAQKFGLPIISLNSCAVPDTGGDGQIILDKDARKFAAAIKVLFENRNYYKAIQQKGFENYNSRFNYDELSRIFLEGVKKFLGGNL